MKFLFVVVCLLVPLLAHAGEDQIMTVKVLSDTTIYQFAFRRVTISCDGVSPGWIDTLKTNYRCWTTPTEIKFISRDTVDQVNILAECSALGKTPTVENIALSGASKIDAIASQLNDKHAIMKFIFICAKLRTDNPTWTDFTVRTVARGVR